VAKGKATSLLDDVLARSSNNRPGFRTWFERLPADAQAELDAVREAYNPNTHQTRAYALAILEAAQERGWATGGVQAVIAWLKKQR
jgi:ABC-type transporter Mla subunit MlaD